MLQILTNPYLRNSLIGTGVIAGITMIVVGVHKSKEKAVVTPPLNEADAKQRNKLEGEIKFLYLLISKQQEKRPMFLTSDHALRVRHLHSKIQYSYVSIPDLETILAEIKTIYDGAEKRT